MSPLALSKCLADDTRLRCILLILREEELCVCELTTALDQVQPKVSRHLAQLRQCGLLEDRRQGQWVFYRLKPQLPAWVFQVLTALQDGESGFLKENLTRLAAMGNRPERSEACC